jgi:hypothetical protein
LREASKRAFLLFLSLCVSVGALEAASRVALRPRPTAPDGTPISRFSPTLGWDKQPGGRQRIRREDFDVEIALNSRGLRGPELPYEPGPGRRRLVIVGDSFAQGYYANEEETLAARLRVALDPCGVDVVNGGQPGFSTDQEWLYFNEELARYRPAETVLLFYYNDLVFNTLDRGTANRPKPLFQEVGSGALVLLPPAAEGSSGESGAPDAIDPAPSAPRFRGSALWAFVAARLQRSRPDWHRALAARSLMPPLSREPAAEFLPFGPRDGAERARVDGMWRRTEAILSAFRADTVRRGGTLSALYVPSRFEANDAAWQWLERRYESRPWDRDVVRRRAAEAFDRAGVPLLDPTDDFRRAERERAVYLPFDGHWNGLGNEVAFRALLPAVRRSLGCA